MRLTNSLRTSAYLAAYGALFAGSFWVPYRWGAQLAPRDETRQAAPPAASALCGLAAAPMPHTMAASSVSSESAAIPERIMLRLDVPLPPLARAWQTPTDAASHEPSPPPEPEETHFVSAPSRQAAIEDDFPALDFAGSPQIDAPAAVAAGLWRRPQTLLALLAELDQCPPAAPWAARVKADLEYLTSPEPLEPQERQARVEGLLLAVAEVEPLIESSDAPSWATLLRRAGYGLARRVNLWQTAMAVEHSDAQRGAPAPETQRLAQCMAQVDHMMQGAAGEGWRAYLMMQSLNELSRARPDSLSTEQRSLARRVLERLDYARQLKDQQQFVSQGPLAALEEQLRLWAVEPVDTSLLAARLERYEETGQASLGYEVAEDVQRLAFSPHAEHQALARYVEEQYRNCNLRVAVSSEMLSRFLPTQEPVEAPVRDVIVGVPVRGRSTTFSELSLKLLPDSQRLRLELSATGLVQSATTSQRGSVAFNTRSESTYTARKVLEFGARCIDAQPAEAEAHTVSRLRGVDSDYDGVPLVGSIVQDYAMDGYRQRREAARREVQAKVAAQARHRLDTLADEGFHETFQTFLDHVMSPLDRMSLVPSYTESHTDEKRFTLRTRLAAPHHLAANTPRPRALSDSLLSVQVHESAMNNVLDRMGLAGTRFTAEELRRHLAAQLNRTKAIEPSSADDYIVTFAAADPVRIRFREGGAELAVSIALLESGSRSWQNFTVYAEYKPVAVERGVELVRHGTIGLEGQRLGMQSQFVLRGTFGRIFSEERRITWLADLLRDQRLAGLQVTQCVIEDGWLGLSIGPHRPGAIALGR
jgi:hypothetical protein